MAAKITRLPQSASPTIDEVFEEFLAEQRGRLKPRTLSRCEEVLNLLRHHLNGYAYESLSKAEAAIFDRYYNAKGGEHREFCQLFGPEKIVESLGGFLPRRRSCFRRGGTSAAPSAASTGSGGLSK